jgi:hypothetical protein
MEIIHEVGGEHLNADFVHAGSASIAFHRFEGVEHEAGIDSAD